SFASWLCLQGTSIFTVKELLGHKKIEMTERYSHLLPSHKQEAVLQLAENQSKAVIELEKKRKKN
ncbi:MAG: tyrosine-type recombinase/integrase, partial [Nitrospinae bacterium]|nr:tyrosine-type recombinase/integrase [Nitrospinota bacterium]